MMVRQTATALLGLILMFMLSGCYEQRTGCLDIDAVNYAVDADQACPDCCTFPGLRVRFLHSAVYPDTVVNFGSPDSVYYDIANNPYRVADFRFFVSDFKLTHNGGQQSAMINKLGVRVFEGMDSRPDSVINDVLLVRPQLTGRNTVGTFRVSGNLESIEFKVGLSEALRMVDTASLPQTHPMNPLASGLDWRRDEGFDFHRMRFVQGLDTLTIRSSALSDMVDISLPVLGMPALPYGYHIEVDILIDYTFWLQDIMLISGTPDALFAVMRQRAPGAFVVADIRYVPT
jgi:hypothetical protein